MDIPFTRQEQQTSKKVSPETLWRSIILFGKNSASYKFAFAKVLLDAAEAEKNVLMLEDIAESYSTYIIEHLKLFDRQGTASKSDFLTTCRKYIHGTVSKQQLIDKTIEKGFTNVLDAFQNVNGKIIDRQFYEKNLIERKVHITLRDELLGLKESIQFKNLLNEAEARWRLVETAWDVDINVNLLDVIHDEDNSLLFIKNNNNRRVNITSVRDALNGYQKGKCFYSFQNISVSLKDYMCDVDHFIPHLLARVLKNDDFKIKGRKVNINGVWNLVLADKEVNRDKSSKITHAKYLQRLMDRNEFYIDSHHPLAETIIRQTGKTKKERTDFLNAIYNLACDYLGKNNWKPKIELPALF